MLSGHWVSSSLFFLVAPSLSLSLSLLSEGLGLAAWPTLFHPPRCAQTARNGNEEAQRESLCRCGLKRMILAYFRLRCTDWQRLSLFWFARCLNIDVSAKPEFSLGGSYAQLCSCKDVGSTKSIEKNPYRWNGMLYFGIHSA